MKLKGILAGAAAVFFAATLAGAANLTLLSGSQYSEPSQILATVNTLIQNINFGVSGRLNASVTATGTSSASTADLTLMSYTLPANRLANTGDAVRVVCWGRTASNANNKIVKLFFGTSSVSLANVGTKLNNQTWRLDLLVMRSGSSAQTIVANGQANAAPLSVSNIVGANNLSANQVIKCTGSTPTAPQDVTATGMLVEQIK